MKRWMVVVAAVAVLLLAGLPVLAVTLSRSDDGHGRDRADHGQGWRKHHDTKPGNGDQHRAGRAKDKAGKDKAGKPWKQAGPGLKQRARGPVPGWSGLTEEQRAKKMAELAQAHADAMKKWAACLAAGKDDCERPLPPGLARRQ